MNTNILRISETAPMTDAEEAMSMGENTHVEPEPSVAGGTPNPSILRALQHAVDKRLPIIFIAGHPDAVSAIMDKGLVLINILDDDPHPYVDAYLEMQK